MHLADRVATGGTDALRAQAAANSGLMEDLFGINLGASPATSSTHHVRDFPRIVQNLVWR